MVTTTILRSQDCVLRPYNNFHSEVVVSPPFHPHHNRNPNTQSKISRQRKRSPVAEFHSKNLVMGEVKILKRGEKLSHPPVREKKNKNGRGVGEADLLVCSTERLGPVPETVQKQIRVSDLKLYAGSAAFLASPPPSSLPFPAFFAMKRDAASSDTRRLLGLDLI